ncbi:hypothetical protein APS56_04100 [Pseudalgibacter alginicilyticus]|uniref:Toprim domain-containing protein n=1 Tax=Pseudalgibacter alginicilyticus TaxID=1736674 RepID=A0A0P0CEF8_9FLAO|nr:DUF6371 domain-containing protein [Pseudalgibacter alginicilyticus]ALJ04370.1 hypothetical protein APS56_04100 [Pseudalgibacter alginicilyticus]
MKDYRYILEPYKGIKTRYRCPACNKSGVFTKYIDTYTNEHLSDVVGACNRLLKCGYHYTPKQYLSDNNIQNVTPVTRVTPVTKCYEKPSYIDNNIVVKSISSKAPNYFLDFLTNHWNKEVSNELADVYKIGTSKHWNGANVFYQIDSNNKVRTGKIMLYNAINGKRVKEPYSHITWVHKVLKHDNFNLKQCLFGEHLINTDISKPIAICESEKTAIIASVYLPEFIWLACGGLNNLNKTNTKVLKGRNVVLFPDAGCYDIWNNKMPQLSHLATFKMSTLIRDKATKEDKKQGLDIADYLLKIR